MPSPSLSVAKLLVLSTAAQRPDRMILPLPPTLHVRGATQKRLLASLLQARLVEELMVEQSALCWRTDPAGQRFALRLTAVGLAAVGDETLAPEVLEPRPAPAADPQPCTADGAEPLPSTPPIAEPARPGGKLGMVLDAISATGGATLAEITGLTGWQPHSARAALTALRQRGFPVQLASGEGGRKAYHAASCT